MVRQTNNHGVHRRHRAPKRNSRGGCAQDATLGVSGGSARVTPRGASRGARTSRRRSNSKKNRWLIITIFLFVIAAILILLLIPRTCTKNHNIEIVGPTHVSAESANFLLLYENNHPVQNVYWNILEGSQYANINHITGELTLNSNAYNSNIRIQGIYNDQATTYNVSGTYVKGKVVKTQINTETYEPIIVVEDLPDTRSPKDPEPLPEPTPEPDPGTISSPTTITDLGTNPIPDKLSSNNGQGKMAIAISALVVLLVSYVVARVKSKDGELVITANAVDKILILASPILCFIAWCPGIDHELSTFQITLFTLSGLMLQGSIIFSIVANKGNALHITLSIMAKLFIFVLTFFLLLLFVAILVITFMLSTMSHSHHEGTYVVKYDHFLDQWVGYRID